MEDVARLSGIPQITRACIWHPLNQKSIARRAAKGLGKSYEECNFVGVHLGGGISVAAHKKGRAVDVNNALGGEGPYTPERAGGVPAHPLVELCYSGEYTKDEIRKLLVGKGGLTAYIGTNNGIEIEKMVNSGDEKAKLVFDGMCYQISKEIGAAATVLKGEVDAIFLTGGLAYNKSLVENIESMVKYICPVMVFPGEDEMLALAEAGLRVLTDVEKAKTI
jgi:butyrate kinase